MPALTLHNGIFTIPDDSARGLIGAGTFGKVYVGTQALLVGDRSVAIKLHDDPFLLDREVKIYAHLWSSIKQGYAPMLRIPRLYWEGHTDDGVQRALVMERLGESLDNVFDRCEKLWTPATVCWVAAQAIELLHGLHDLGIVHRDIKPDNFACGIDTVHPALYLIDFGLSAQYIDRNREHRTARDGISLIGTIRYASIPNHEGNLQSRRDDLESLCYVLLYFWQGTLAWKDALRGVEDRQERMRRALACKRALHNAATGSESHSSTLPTTATNLATAPVRLPRALHAFYRYVRTLRYDEAPAYERWIEHFRKEYDGRAGGDTGRGGSEGPKNSREGKRFQPDWLKE